MRKISLHIITVSCLLLILCAAFPSAADERLKDLTASLALIPGIIDSQDKGPFVDLVKEIGANTDKNIKIEVFPFARSVDNVLNGKADFHVPTIRNRAVDESDIPYRFTTEKYGTVSFVIYSNTERPITKKMIEEALEQKGAFPYTFEVPASLEKIFGFPCLPSNDLSLSLQKVERKRIDGLIWAQEEVDLALNNMKLGNIRREHWVDFDDTIIIQKGPRGDQVDAILSKAIKKMKDSGDLEKIYSKVHHPYDDWQPSEMGWAAP